MCANHDEAKPLPGESRSEMRERLAEEERARARYAAEAEAADYESGPAPARAATPSDFPRAG